MKLVGFAVTAEMIGEGEIVEVLGKQINEEPNRIMKWWEGKEL